MARAVGIDLGTTNSVISVLESGEPEVISNAEGSRTTPSVVAFRDNETLVGEVAKRQAITNPTRTIASVKRSIGTSKTFQIGTKTYTPQEISARILSKLKRDAEAYLGETVTQAVITVPAYFNDAQRQATKEAGQIAGLEVLRIVNEPTAAALAYGLDRTDDATIGVFDLGGGTFDVSILDLGGGVFEVLSTAGDTHLGGDDWDNAIVDWLVKGFRDSDGVDLSTDRMAVQRLKEAAEKAKIELSSMPDTEINLPFITATSAGPLHLNMKLTRSEFERITEPLLERVKAPFLKAVSDAGIDVADLDEVILVGGSTRMPAVVRIVEELSGMTPHKGVNPDEVVAAGAAIQAGVLTGGVRDVLLLDVTPLSLSIETKGGIATRMIERNTTIPTRATEMFSTAEANQTEVEIHVVQGEREMAADNRSLGKFRLTGLPPAPAGVPQIEVSFDIDANGIVSVSAKDTGTNTEQSMTITGGTALSKDEIDAAIADAQRYAEQDKARRDEADTRNAADQLVRSVRTMLAGQPGIVEGDEAERISELTARLEGDVNDPHCDVATLRSHMDELSAATQAVAERVYARQGAATAGPDASYTDIPTGRYGAQDGFDDGEVIDADIVG